MPKRGRKFITEFLVPYLNGEKFGTKLAWVDRAGLIFQMQWNHKSASAWTEDDFQVFVEWDKKRGHYKPMEKEYFTKSKQRFRAVLNKSIQDNEITQLQFKDKNIKIYFLGPAEAAPFDLKFDIVKDAMDDIPTDYLGGESELLNALHTVENQSTKTDYSNALKDHNYPVVEEHQIPEMSDNISCDTFLINDLSLYPVEKNASTYADISALTNDEKFLENLSLALLDPKKECNFQQEDISLVYEYCDQALHEVETCVSENSAPENSLKISSKRRLEHSDCHSAKRSKSLLYLKAET